MLANKFFRQPVQALGGHPGRMASFNILMRLRDDRSGFSHAFNSLADLHDNH